MTANGPTPAEGKNGSVESSKQPADSKAVDWEGLGRSYLATELERMSGGQDLRALATRINNGEDVSLVEILATVGDRYDDLVELRNHVLYHSDSPHDAADLYEP